MVTLPSILTTMTTYHSKANQIKVFIKVTIRPKKKKDVVLPFRCQNMGQSVGPKSLSFFLPLMLKYNFFLKADCRFQYFGVGRKGHYNIFFF